MISTVSINIRENDRDSFPLLQDCINFLEENNCTVKLPPYDSFSNNGFSSYISDFEDFVNTDLVIAIGGDGTFLRTARTFLDYNKPIFGINRGTLGFLTEFNPSEYKKFLHNVIHDKAVIVNRSVLKASYQSETEERELFFLNDAVISKGAFSRVIVIEMDIDDVYLNRYSGDGLIISTPTGSTAYSLSAGGPIITPSASHVYLVTPICPHTLAMRPMILRDSAVLKVRVVSDIRNLMLTIDGQEAIRIDGGDTVTFSRTDRAVQLITHPEKNYYDILREKLNWG